MTSLLEQLEGWGSLLHPQNPRINELVESEGRSGWLLQRNQAEPLCSTVVLPS